MDQATLPVRPDTEAAVERRTRILDAAERCFVRAGFHRTTMQDVAAEAGMSPGNLYRYFRSKDSIVAGLSERDRAEVAAGFSALERADDFASAFAAFGRRYFEEEPREKAILCLEIWAEATRNPAMGALTADFERDVIGRITNLVAAAQASGAIKAKSDARDIAIAMSTLADGVFVRRAIAPAYDAAREVGIVMKIIAALLDGTIDLSKSNQPSGASP